MIETFQFPINFHNEWEIFIKVYLHCIAMRNNVTHTNLYETILTRYDDSKGKSPGLLVNQAGGAKKSGVKLSYKITPLAGHPVESTTNPY